ncbi:protein ApaG [Neoasaia chiangmaiensis]|uniref:Co2+/Mg2+ efflux protein ApaG n=1 Tax=Neoasaia chiangmaiensis TaxID=320497 RepID=A0A1U9KNM2_9PROT|nr:Co2+/Mg2+ efflux protein ApaG [Neoasaia chiangmaiensis]AQS87404.1 Co2+/Mg2+ efflux protein ApaG [Neoasaia chiangmaiensis]GEN16175.1 protein ApaG [Neoasaia chiangmaiensis]
MAQKPLPPRLIADPEAALAEAMEAAPRFEARTNDITVCVRTFWLDDQSQPDEHRYAWAYYIHIANEGTETVQLVSRSWEIIDGRGQVEHVHGEGVVGERPVIGAGESFEYTSGAALDTPSGFMRGTYHMIVPGTKQRFDVKIPVFSLDSPHQSGLLH